VKPRKKKFDPSSKKLRSVCSACKTFFNKGEDIIFCPNDEKPHHVSCWEEAGGCSSSKCNYKIPKKKGKKSFFQSLINTFFWIFFAIGILLVAGFVFFYFIDKEFGITQTPDLVIERTKVPVQTVTPITLPSPTPLPAVAPSEKPKETPVDTDTPAPSPSETPGDHESVVPFEGEKTPTKKEVPEKEPTGQTEEKSTQRKAVDIALKQIGKPYVWETTGPDTFDCAGLCSYSYWLASGKEWSNWYNIFYVSDLLNLCKIHEDFSEIRPGDFLVRNNFQHLKPFEERNFTGPEYDWYDTKAAGWPYGLSPVHDYGHIGMYAGEITYEGVYYKNAVIEARGKDYGVVICDLDNDGDGYSEWGNFFYRPQYCDF